VAAAITTLKSANEGQSASRLRRYGHSADRDRGRGRAAHRAAAASTLSVPLPTSPSPTPSIKHRKLDDSKDGGKSGSYAMQYKKYQQQSSPRTELLRTELPGTESRRSKLPMRPCIKYQPDTPNTVTTAPTTSPYCHQLLSEMEPALMDEQPLTDVDPLPPLSDHELFDSLEEYETSRDDDRQAVTEVESVLSPVPDETIMQDQPASEVEVQTRAFTISDQPASEMDVSSADISSLPQKPDEISNTDLDTLSTNGLEPITESVPTEEAAEPEEPVPEVVPVEDTGSVAAELMVASEVPPETPSEDDEAVKGSSGENVEDHSPEVDVKDTSGQSENNEVL